MSATPIPLAQRIAERRVPTGNVGAWWLGGSGFIFKTSSGRQVWIDAYLSDAVQTMFGLGRAFPSPITAEAAAPDLVICTHWHEDHLDPGSIPEIARRRPAAKFFMPPSALSRAVSWGLAPSRVTPLVAGQFLDLGELKLTALPARHDAAIVGWETPDAVGVMLDFAGVRVYHTGDTDYEPRIHRALASTPLALATLCINGAVGNMNAHEAALLAWQLDARSVVPHHHRLWARPPEKIPRHETLDPMLFADTYRKLGGNAEVVIPEIGRDLMLSERGLSLGGATA